MAQRNLWIHRAMIHKSTRSVEPLSLLPPLKKKKNLSRTHTITFHDVNPRSTKMKTEKNQHSTFIIIHHHISQQRNWCNWFRIFQDFWLPFSTHPTIHLLLKLIVWGLCWGRLRPVENAIVFVAWLLGWWPVGQHQINEMLLLNGMLQSPKMKVKIDVEDPKAKNRRFPVTSASERGHPITLQAIRNIWFHNWSTPLNGLVDFHHFTIYPYPPTLICLSMKKWRWDS